MNITIKSNALGTITATLRKSKNLGDRPKTYKEIEYVSHSIGSSYNSSRATLLQNSQKDYIIEIYRDGSFYPYYAKLYNIKSI